MPGPPGYDLHQCRDASLQVAKPEHTIETDIAAPFQQRDELRSQLASATTTIAELEATPVSEARLTVSASSRSSWRNASSLLGPTELLP
jgi:hypothetical protein